MGYKAKRAAVAVIPVHSDGSLGRSVVGVGGGQARVDGDFVGFLFSGGGVYGDYLFLEDFFACRSECLVGDVY